MKLFCQLFRGRPDVYPTRFVSKKTGMPGYAPACSNKFVPELMTTDQLTAEQKAASPFFEKFWDSRGWGLAFRS